MKYRWYRFKEAVPRKIAWLLPKKVAYWATLRVMANATTGQYSDQIVPELTAMDVLKRWSQKT